MGEEARRAAGDSRDPGGGLPLPGLKHWRERRGISQAELARRADLLGVGLEALRTKPGAAFDMETPPKPDRPKVPYRHVHKAYLRIFLEGAVGSAYAAMEEWELEERLEGGTWEGALEIVRARGREVGYLRDALGVGEVMRDPDLPEDVRSFLEAVLESFPDLDIHLLATVRRRETSEEGHEALTKAMRGLL